MITDDVLIYDIETKTFGKPDPEKDIFKFFGCYSYKTKKFYLLRDKESVQKIIDAHRFLVGFNNRDYDNPILERAGVNFKYKLIIDLYIVFDSRSTVIKLKEGLLEDLLMEKSLDYISRLLKLVTDDNAKMHFDYKLLQKDSWTEEEMKIIFEYTKRDVEITAKMYEWLDTYFESLKEFISEKDYNNKIHISADPAVVAYKAICNAMHWEDETEFNAVEEEKIKGGYVSYPAGDKYVDNVYLFDFDSLYPSIMNQSNLYGRKLSNEINNRPTWSGNNVWKVEGIYYADNMSPVSALIRKWFELRMIYKKEKDPRENSIKIILNIIYGILKNPRFKRTADIVAAGDCTRLGRQFEQYARRVFNEEGYEIIYSDTDSTYIFDSFKDKERLLKVRDKIINYIRSTLPFPYEHFGMKLEEEIKYLFFFKGDEKKTEEDNTDFMSDSFDFINRPKQLMKKNYIYVTKDNKLVIKNLGIKKKSNSKLSRKIFWDELVPQIKEKGEIKFSKAYITGLINKYLDKDITLACLRYEVGVLEQYSKSPNSIYAQIAKKYGSGIFFLIPNNKIGIGKDKKYCTVEEFRENNMKKDDINLDNVWSELNYFVKAPITKNIFEY